MLRLSLSFFWWFASFFRSRHDLALELLALRQQVGVLKRMNPRPRLLQINLGGQVGKVNHLQPEVILARHRRLHAVI